MTIPGDSKADGDTGHNADHNSIADVLTYLDAAVFNVKAGPYGALGDGSTDDTSAIAAAISAASTAGGGTVFFPPGTYKFTTFSVPAGVDLLGAGFASTTLDQRGAGITASAEWLHQRFANFTITSANLTGDQSYMFDVTDGAARCQFALRLKVHPTHITTAAIRHTGASDGHNNVYHQPVIDPSSGTTMSCAGIYLAGTGTNDRTNSNMLIGCVINGATVGVKIDACQATFLLRPDFGNCTTALQINALSGDTNGCYGHTVFGGYFDSTNTTQVSLVNNNAADEVYMLQVYNAVGVYDDTDFDVTGTGSGSVGYGVQNSYGVFGTGTSRSSVVYNKWGQIVDDSFFQISGGPTQPSGRFIVSGSSYAGGTNLVDDAGGASAVIADGAEFRVVHTANGSSFSKRFAVDSDGNVIMNASGAALATDTTTGFAYLPICLGAPTGTPASQPTGTRAMIYDATNHKLYVYDSGWKSVTLA